VTRSRTLRGSVLALATVLAVSACSTHPGKAAVVGSDRISTDQVDEVATALCAAQAGGDQNSQQPQELASRAARQGALDVLINSALSRQFGESEGVEPDQKQVAAALAANSESINGLPEKSQQVFTDTLKGYAEGQLMLIEVGRRELAQSGAAKPTEEQSIAEGTKLRNKWAADNADISVDPRFGEYSKNALVSKSGSLSVATSKSATDGGSPDPSQGWVASLPATQKCG
jgi:hypothetical protein